MLKRYFYKCKHLLSIDLLGLSFNFLTVLPAQASFVKMTVIGTVNFADASNPNPFGLSVNDSVTAMAIYDNTGIPGIGIDSLEIDDSTFFSLTITLGNITYKEAGDIAFGFGGPELEFFNGNISGIGFFQIHWVVFQIYALEAFQLQRRMVCLKTNSFSMTSN